MDCLRSTRKSRNSRWVLRGTTNAPLLLYQKLALPYKVQQNGTLLGPIAAIRRIGTLVSTVI